MRVERKETRRSMRALRLSTRRARRIAVSPGSVPDPVPGIQMYPSTVTWVAPPGRPARPPARGIQMYPSTVTWVAAPRAPPRRTWYNRYALRTVEPAMAPTTTWPPPSGSLFPNSPTMTNANRGRRRMNQAYSNNSPPQEPHLVELDRPVGLVDREEHGEPHGGLRGRDRNPEEGEDEPARVRGRVVRAECDEVQDRRADHDLDRHEDDDPVLPGDDPAETDAQEEGRQDELVLEGDHGPTPSRSIFAR